MSDRVQFDPEVHLTLANVAYEGLNQRGVFRVRIRVSKTDQCRVDPTIILASTGSSSAWC